MVSRTWGYWTEQKLAMLAAYLPAFNNASRSVRMGTTYLDLFAGDTSNISRTTGDVISGSPLIALDALPPFARVVLFELPAQASRLEAVLRQRYPDRDLKVWAGDCNDRISDALAALERHRGAPTFALVDQYAAEIHWSSLERLARFKQHSPYKTELWLLFAPSMLRRGLAAEDAAAVSRFESRIDAMYGCRDWAPIVDARQAGAITGAALREQLTNLMRWRLETVLGYGTTHAFEMKNVIGAPIYTMIFATDNAAGDRIMSHIYGQASEMQPRMRAEALAKRQAMRDEESGALGLFDPPPPELPPGKLYQHQPPTRPFGTSLCAECDRERAI